MVDFCVLWAFYLQTCLVLNLKDRAHKSICLSTVNRPGATDKQALLLGGVKAACRSLGRKLSFPEYPAIGDISHCYKTELLLNWQDRKGQKRKKRRMPRLKANSSVGIKEQASPKTSGDVFVNAARHFIPKAVSSHPWFIPMKHLIYEIVNTGLTNNE